MSIVFIYHIPTAIQVKCMLKTMKYVFIVYCTFNPNPWILQSHTFLCKAILITFLKSVTIYLASFARTLSIFLLAILSISAPFERKHANSLKA